MKGPKMLQCFKLHLLLALAFLSTGSLANGIAHWNAVQDHMRRSPHYEELYSQQYDYLRRLSRETQSPRGHSQPGSRITVQEILNHGGLAFSTDKALSDQTVTEIRQIFNRLHAQLPPRLRRETDLVVVLGGSPNASAGPAYGRMPQSIFINLAVLKLIHESGAGADGLAFVLGHELFHLLRFRHMERNAESALEIEAGRQFEELRSDRFGLRLMVNAGFNPLNAAKVFDAIEALGAGVHRSVLSAMGENHPPMRIRLSQINVMIERSFPNSISRPTTPLNLPIAEIDSQIALSERDRDRNRLRTLYRLAPDYAGLINFYLTALFSPEPSAPLQELFPNHSEVPSLGIPKHLLIAHLSDLFEEESKLFRTQLSLSRHTFSHFLGPNGEWYKNREKNKSLALRIRNSGHSRPYPASAIDIAQANFLTLFDANREQSSEPTTQEYETLRSHYRRNIEMILSDIDEIPDNQSFHRTTLYSRYKRLTELLTTPVNEQRLTEILSLISSIDDGPTHRSYEQLSIFLPSAQQLSDSLKNLASSFLSFREGVLAERFDREDVSTTLNLWNNLRFALNLVVRLDSTVSRPLPNSVFDYVIRLNLGAEMNWFLFSEFSRVTHEAPELNTFQDLVRSARLMELLDANGTPHTPIFTRSNLWERVGGRTTLVRALQRLQMSEEQIKFVLENDFFWHSGSKHSTNRERQRRFYQRRQFFGNVDNQSASVLLHRLQEIWSERPISLESEIEFFDLFTRRTISSETDQWAEALMNRIQRTPYSEQQKAGLYRRLVMNRRVLSLRLRIELVSRGMSQDFSTALEDDRRTRLVPSRFRNRREGSEKDVNREVRRRFPNFVSLVEHHFPEISSERREFVDRVLMSSRLPPSDVRWIGQRLGINDQNVRDPSAENPGQAAIGVRTLSGLFQEVTSKDYRTQIEFLDYMLGHSNSVPTINDRFTRYAPQIRTTFLSQSVEVRCALVDPLFIGTQGLAMDPRTQDWLLERLIPSNASWSELATRLFVNYNQALQDEGLTHLRTLFLSYVLVSKTVREPNPFFGAQNNESGDELFQFVRDFFSANSALIKIGQRIHSARLLSGSAHEALASLKDRASNQSLFDLYELIDEIGRERGVDVSRLRIDRILGSASVKDVLLVNHRGENNVMSLIRPAAAHRGELFFRVALRAIRRTIDEGHTELRPVVPLVEHAQRIYRQELDLENEGRFAENLESSYRSVVIRSGERTFRFEFPRAAQGEIGRLNSRHVRINQFRETRAFFALSGEQARNYAEAILAAETQRLQMLRESGTQALFDLDRHEGNYLILEQEDRSDPSESRLLMIDFGQGSELTAESLDKLTELLALLTHDTMGTLDRGTIVQGIESSLSLGSGQRESLTQVLEVTGSLSPIERLPRLLAEIEGGGARVPESLWDLISYLQTLQSFEQYTPESPLRSELAVQVLGRCQEQFQSSRRR